MRTLLAIANAEAGTADDQSVDTALEVLRADADVTLVRTSSPDDLDQALSEHSDVDGVVALGGDGSVHAVVAAMHAADRLSDTFVAIIPLGTGNDFAHTIGLPDEPADAARLVRDGTVRSVDLVLNGNDDVVVNAAHIGVGAEAAAAAVPWKKRFGPLGYVIGSLVAGVRSLIKPGARVEITVDGKRLPGHRVVQVAVGNGRYVGGGTLLLPEADPADGLLDIAISYPASPIRRIGYVLSLRSGQHVRRADVTYLRGSEMTVRGDAMPSTSDGELTDPRSDHSWRIVPGAWRLVMPS
ncbi:MAG: YegS/Rv2252/BmrU family lipid kinase [Aeromicrobium sp.]|uniref:diacylglycerol/lipid kinase family protein n=1 Tax=Aeromicrobium sp. TaxID=1871063 RepID=UPI003C4CD481